MDPTSVAANIIAIVRLNKAIISYLRDMHDAPQDRMSFAIEISVLDSLLTVLHDRVQEAKFGDPWFTAVRTLAVENGPLHLFKSSLERVVSKLEPVHANKIASRFTWCFDKAEIKDLLSRIERVKTFVSLALANLFSLSQAIKEGISDIRSHVADLRVIQTNQERRSIVDWLSPLDFKAFQSETFHKRVHGTGQWLLESREFAEWRDGASETLWCPGIPGAGKTVLASIVIDHLQTMFKDDTVAILCIYCNYQQTEQTVSRFVASLLKQLVQDSFATSDNINSFYRRHHGRGIHPTLDEYRETFQSEVGTYSKVFIVVDALDECREDNCTREDLLQMLRSLSGSINLMVTSRNLSTIARDFHGTKRLDIHAIDQDVRRYLECRIPREPRLARLVKSNPTLQERIVSKIVVNVRGMFLLARLHMDSLCRKTNLAAVHKALETLPKGMDEVYDKAMEQIEEQVEDDRNLAKQVLSWIAFARRQLSVKELQHALAVRSDMTDMDLDAIDDEEVLTSVCVGLVIIDEEHSVIHLVHHTTQEYFECNQASLFPDAQANITATCLTYLSLNVFGRGYCHDDQELQCLLEANALFEYAVCHWGHHACGQPEEICKDMALNFLQDNAKVSCASQVLLTQGNRFEGQCQWVAKNFSGMHIASFFGLERIIDYLLQNGADMDSKDSHGQTPLSVAAENGYDKVVKLLMAQDNVDVNSKNKWHKAPLSLAAGNGHWTVVKLLVAQDSIGLNMKDKRGVTPLAMAAAKGYNTVVSLLLVQNKIEVNVKDKWGGTPLASAAANGHEAVVKLLLAQDNIEVNVKNKYGMTPLALLRAKYPSGLNQLKARHLSQEDSGG